MKQKRSPGILRAKRLAKAHDGTAGVQFHITLEDVSKKVRREIRCALHLH
jgi:hypothetical protein